jgi:hypothetical protein
MLGAKVAAKEESLSKLLRRAGKVELELFSARAFDDTSLFLL